MAQPVLFLALVVSARCQPVYSRAASRRGGLFGALFFVGLCCPRERVGWRGHAAGCFVVLRWWCVLVGPNQRVRHVYLVVRLDFSCSSLSWPIFLVM